jgi:hypothetical protein
LSLILTLAPAFAATAGKLATALAAPETAPRARRRTIGGLRAAPGTSRGLRGRRRRGGRRSLARTFGLGRFFRCGN